MKSAGNPPPPPDPTTSANAQSAANIQTAIANARLNRVNQTTPWGSISYTQGPPDANGVPTYSSNISLSPQQQALLDQQQSGQLTRAQLANQILAQSGSTIAKPLDFAHLQAVYNPYDPSHQWSQSPAATPAVAAPAAAAPQAPAMAAQPSQVGQNGAARSPQIAALASMLRGNASTPSQETPAAASAAPTGDPFGTWGNLNSMIGTTKPDTSKLPPEIAAQLQDEVRVDEGGAQSHNYNFNENPWGGFKDSDGKYWVQVGDPNSNKAGDGGIKDKSKVVYKPGAGYVTTPDNLNDYGGGGIDWRMVLAVVGAGLAGGAAGLGADAAGGAAGGAGEAAAGSGLAPLQGVTLAPETSIGTMGTYGGAGEAAGGLGPMAEMGGPSAGAGVPVTDLSVQAQQPSILQNMLQNAQNGRGLLGYGNGATQGIGSVLSRLLQSQGQQGGRR
jgi:hypothetical protein